jgi:hypothetical protein
VLILIGSYKESKKKQEAVDSEQLRKRAVAEFGRKEAERKEQERKMKKEERERMENSLELFMSWVSKPWKEKTNSIYTITDAKIYGRCNLFTKQWNPVPMTVYFYFKNWHWSVELD